MKRSFFSALFLIVVSVHQAFACLNGESIHLSTGGIIGQREEGTIIPYGNDIFFSSVKRELPLMHQKWTKTKDVNYLSDYGLLLVLDGQYDKARDTFLYLESIAPDRYSTAANLGTVYELLGDNGQALAWISRAVEINPASHMRSEWLHVKILEAKLAGASAVTSNFLLNTSFGTDALPRTSLPQAKLLKLRDALFYQLNERVTFIKPTDAIVAQLLFDLGNVAYLSGAKSEAKIIYRKAKEYGYQNSLLSSRLSAVSSRR